MSVEELIGYMNEDEVIAEVTPLSVRLKKLELDAGEREGGEEEEEADGCIETE